MARVQTELNYVEVEGDFGPVEGIELTCDKCGHTEECAGTHSGSIARCAYLLRENCPLNENNFYITE